MRKKTWIIGGTTLGVIVAAGTALGVSIALTDHKTEWKVKLDNINGVRYFTTHQDGVKPEMPKTLVFDIDKSDHEQLTAVAKKIGDSESNIVSTLQNAGTYKNGLVKLVYDLLHSEKRADSIDLSVKSTESIYNLKAQNSLDEKSVTNLLMDLFISGKNKVETFIWDKSKKDFVSLTEAILKEQIKIASSIK